MTVNKKTVLRGILIFFAALLCAALIYGLTCFISYQTVKDTGLPKIEITTENREKITSKENYVKCTVNLLYADEYAFEDAAAGIRGRGNDTWKYYPKKPYRIKFDEKMSVFGEAKNKSWVLLAMYNDFSLIKDRLAFTMADAVENDSFSPSYHYVELYLNGKYKGIYLLTDQVDENKGRTEVKGDFTEDTATVPFLVELDARAPEEGVEGVDWFYVGARPYAIKYPEADERHTKEQFAYIKGYIEKVDSLCRTPGVTMAALSEYIDMESFMDYYLIQELMGQPEINWKSVYMSKAQGERLVMGPVWDFDWAAMGPSVGRNRNMYRGKYDGFRSVDNWFMALYEGSPEFRDALRLRFSEIKDELSVALRTVQTEKKEIVAAAKRDRLRWHWYRIFVNFESYSDEVIEWCENRLKWMNCELDKA